MVSYLKYIFSIVFIISIFHSSLSNEVLIASCHLHPTSSGTQGVSGTVKFTQSSPESKVQVKVELNGLTAQEERAIHVHAYGDLLKHDGTSLGGHYSSQDDQVHALPEEEHSRHTGDMGNVQADDNGDVDTTLELDLLSLSGAVSIIGRGVVLHKTNDKGYQEQPAGDAGARDQVCVIGRGVPSNSADENIADQQFNGDIHGVAHLDGNDDGTAKFKIHASNNGKNELVGVLNGFSDGKYSVSVQHNGDLVNGIKGTSYGEVDVQVNDESSDTCVTMELNGDLSVLLGSGIQVKDHQDQVVAQGVIGVANPDMELDLGECEDVDSQSSDASVVSGSVSFALMLLFLIVFSF